MNGLFYYKKGNSNIIRSKVVIPTERSLIITKVSKDISIDHPSVPKITRLQFMNNIVYEYRRFDGEFSVLSSKEIKESKENRKFRFITQIIDFINYLSHNNMICAIFKLKDLISFSFIDSSDNLFIFDTSFIEISNEKYLTKHMNLLSCGYLTLEILVGEFNEKENINYENISAKWIDYIKMCIGAVAFESDFRSRFMPQKIHNSAILEIFSHNSAKTSNFNTLKELIEGNNLCQESKEEIVKSLVNILEEIILKINNQENTCDYQISADAFTIDTIALDENNKICFLNTGIWVETNEQQNRLFNLQYQLLFRLGHIINQIMSNKVIKSLSEWYEDTPLSIDGSFPLYIKISLFFCWFFSEYFQKTFYQDEQLYSRQKELFTELCEHSNEFNAGILIRRIKYIIEEKSDRISLRHCHLYYPFIDLSFETRLDLITKVFSYIEDIFNEKHLQCFWIRDVDIILDDSFNLVKILECCFDKCIEEYDDEGNKNLIRDKLAYFPENDIGMIMYQLFTNKEEYCSKIKENIPGYLKKLIKLCFTPNSIFFVPFKSFYNSLLKRRISKKQMACLWAMKHQIKEDEIKTIKLLGRGGSSDVYLMENDKTIKILRTNDSYNDPYADIYYDIINRLSFQFFSKKYERFVKELRMMIFTSSANIFNLYNICFYPNGEVGLIMDYIPEIIGTLINKSKLSNEKALQYSIQIAEFMRKIHDFGIIHRDVKPDNIGINKEGKLVIIDYGLSEFSKEGQTIDFVGTPFFMAPELYKMDTYDNKVDVYAFAITMDLIFGASINNSGIKTQNDLRRKVLNGWRMDIPSNVPKYVARLIRRCWDEDPNKRPPFDEIVGILKNSMYDNEFQEDKYDSIDWSKRDGMCHKDGRSYIYNIFHFNEEKRESIKSTLDEIFMSGNPHINRLEDYIFAEEKICMIYYNEVMVSLSEFIEKNEETTRKRFLFDNIEYLMSTFDLLHSKGLVVRRMNSKTIKVASHSVLFLSDILIPGITSDASFEDYDFIDAPEIKTTHEFTVASNVYSFGAMIAYILNGWEAFYEDGSINIRSIDKKYQQLVRLCKSDNRPDFQYLYKVFFPSKYRSYSQCIDLMNTRLSIFQTIQFRIDDLNVLREIGRGQFSRVYLAENKRTKSVIVVKECNMRNKQEILSPIFQELAALNVLNHPNLIRILGTVTSPTNGVRILMEFADKGDLSSFISSRTLSMQKIAKLLVDISCGMNFMHVRNVIHRDLKPENVLISHNRALVSDFNSAAFVSDCGIPLVFGMHGTKFYMSPEMMNLEPCSFSTDVFSFGMIICCCFTKDIQTIWDRILRNEEVDFSFIDDESMRNLAKQCLEFDSSRRPTFEFIGRFLIKKFKLTKYKTESLYPSRHDLSQIEGMRNQLISGNHRVTGDYGRHLLLEGKIEEAKHAFKQGSEDGSCMNNYGMLLYLEGSRRESIYYFNKAAELGNVYALMVLGIRSECPELFDELADESPSKFKKALDFYQRAATTSDRLSHIENPKAKYLEGLLYESNLIEGVDEEESRDLSIRCFKEAALEYDSDGLNKIGLLLEGGFIEDEYEKGFESYFRMSASQMNPSGLKNMSRILKSRDANKSKYYDGLSRLFGGSDVGDFRRAGDVLSESWELHGQLSEITRGYEVGTEMGDQQYLSHLRSNIISGLGIHQNAKCSKHMNEELSFVSF